MSITITEKAAEKVQEIAKAEDLAGQGLRLRVIGGGCAGFRHGNALAYRRAHRRRAGGKCCFGHWG